MGKKNGEWSYHMDPNGHMVPCANHPCRLHGGNDIVASSVEEAYLKADESEQSRGLDAEVERKDEEDTELRKKMDTMIGQCSLSVVISEGKPCLYSRNLQFANREENATWIRAHKEDLIKEIRRLAAEKKAKDERRMRAFHAIDGLDRIMNMMDTYDEEGMQRERAIYGDGIVAPKKRTVTEDDIAKELAAHPLAALWIDANERSMSHSPELASIGVHAKDAILDGVPMEQVKADIKKAEDEFFERHRWD